MLGKTERRLALVILLTAIIPLAVAVVLADSFFNRASLGLADPEISQQLGLNVDLYGKYIPRVKADMKHQADAIALDPALRDALKAKDVARVSQRLTEIVGPSADVVSLVVEDADGNIIAQHDRGRPVDAEHEKKLEQRRELGPAPDPPLLVATFAFDNSFESDLLRAGNVKASFDNLAAERKPLYAFFIKLFAALLGVTMIVTVVLGFLLARGVTRRINRLANAINIVAAGDLTVRVPVTGSDELTELSRVFNRMLGEMQQSRARIEYLQRIGAWQEMAQRLAHEIKNPLTPIQLAVQECHRKYPGDDKKYRALLDTTREIVEEEVGTLRRLVGNFSNFARLPQAELEESDLRDFLRECSERLVHLETGDLELDPLASAGVDIQWDVPERPLRASIDRQMLRRVLVNLVRNSVQAIRDAKAGSTGTGRVMVSARPDGEGAAIEVEDDGPGIAEDSRERVFEPYFTTKVEGTGLGLAIVKKVVVEHGGSIEVSRSASLGGARFIVHLPGPHSLALAAAGPASVRPSNRVLG